MIRFGRRVDDVTMRVLVMLAIALGTARARASDLQLMIQRDPSACRDSYATARATPEEVTEDLLSAFQGREPRIRALRAIVMNAHLGYCTRGDRLEFERGLVEIGTHARLVHERKYTDLVLMLATENVVKEIEARLGRRDLAAGARKRLEYLRGEAPRWIELRRTGKRPPRGVR